jgi:hypothetical protein
LRGAVSSAILDADVKSSQDSVADDHRAVLALAHVAESGDHDPMSSAAVLARGLSGFSPEDATEGGGLGVTDARRNRIDGFVRRLEEVNGVLHLEPLREPVGRHGQRLRRPARERARDAPPPGYGSAPEDARSRKPSRSCGW